MSKVLETTKKGTLTLGVRIIFYNYIIINMIGFLKPIFVIHFKKS